jgi:putative flavoprotein involved in K+ transport
VGAADLVTNGEVALAHGRVSHLTEDSVVLEDGAELPADLVVYATGYGSMNGWAADLISQEVADRVGKVWRGCCAATSPPAQQQACCRPPAAPAETPAPPAG